MGVLTFITLPSKFCHETLQFEIITQAFKAVPSATENRHFSIPSELATLIPDTSPLPHFVLEEEVRSSHSTIANTPKHR